MRIDTESEEAAANLVAAFTELFRTLHNLQRQQPSNNVVGAALTDTQAAWDAFMDYLLRAARKP